MAGLLKPGRPARRPWTSCKMTSAVRCCQSCSSCSGALCSQHLAFLLNFLHARRNTESTKLVTLCAADIERPVMCTGGTRGRPAWRSCGWRSWTRVAWTWSWPACCRSSCARRLPSSDRCATECRSLSAMARRVACLTVQRLLCVVGGIADVASCDCAGAHQRAGARAEAVARPAGESLHVVSARAATLVLL